MHCTCALYCTCGLICCSRYGERLLIVPMCAMSGLSGGVFASLDNFLCPLAECCLSRWSVKFAVEGLYCATHPWMHVSMHRLYDCIHEAVWYPYLSITTNFTVMHAYAVVLHVQKTFLLKVRPVGSSSGIGFVVGSPIMVQHGYRSGDFFPQEGIKHEKRLPIQ